MINVGKSIVKAMSHLTEAELKNSILNSFRVYKFSIKQGYELSDSKWFALHDIFSLHWGYYGDLDIHIDEMEVKINLLVNFSSKEQIFKAVEEAWDFYEKKLEDDEAFQQKVLSMGGSIIE